MRCLKAASVTYGTCSQTTGEGRTLPVRDLDLPVDRAGALAVAVEVVDAEPAIATEAAAATREVDIGIAVAVPSESQAGTAPGGVAGAVVEQGAVTGAAGDCGAKVELVGNRITGRLRSRGGAGAALDRFELHGVEDEVITSAAAAATAERGPLHGFGVKG